MPPRTRRTPADGPPASPADPGVPPPTDAALEALAANLAATGARSRRARRTAATPAIAYSAALRQRLLAEPGAPEAVEGALALAALPPVVEPLSDALLAGGVAEPAAEAAEGLAAEAPALRLERRRYRRPDPSPGTVSPWSDERAALPVEVAPPTRRPRWRSRRLVALTVAVIVVAAAALGARMLLMPRATLQAVAGEVAGAVLTRGGQSSTLQAGTILLEGDTITVSPTGNAAFSVGGSIARLAGGAVVHLDAIDAQGITIAELAGRVYNRVDPADGVPYRVVTGPLTWTASGTAFDVDRTPVLAGEGAGGERVTVLAVEHDVALAGPGLEENVAQGQQAVVLLGGSGPIQPQITAAAGETWQDPWLVENGRLDQVLGFPLGSLTAELATASPSSSPEATPSAEPTVSASPSGEPSASPSAAATPTVAPATPPRGGPSPSPSPSPTPKPTPGLATLDLTLRACPGGVVIDWGTYTGSGFHHYRTLRNGSPDIPLAYPPQDGAVDFGGTYTTVKTRTDAIDADPLLGIRYYYRSMAFDKNGKVIGASAVKSVVGAGDALDLGTLSVSGDSSGLSFGWSAYGGGANCFTAYKLVYSAADPNPSILKGSALLWGGGNASYSGLDGLTIAPGTYWFRVQAVRVTALGQFVTGQSAAVQYTVP